MYNLENSANGEAIKKCQKSVKYKKKVILCAIIILKMIEEGKTLLSFMEVFIVGGKYTTQKYKIKQQKTVIYVCYFDKIIKKPVQNY